ncbi:hypothetical protein C6501_12580 [Candidatus Poribacteria bacterium]|nr:MAG: hypothetical protein C6501_12580 [Candidatus Poribacteria bacterium]
MSKKTIWGFAALIILLIAAGGFIYWQMLTVQQMKEQAAQDAKMLEEGNHKPKQPSVTNKPPREAKDGFKWEWHGDHWHEMPIAQAPQQTPIVQPEQVKQPVVTYTGPLTYHEELLKTNPVKALRLQQEERGHWSAEHIPPFPADDTEAQEYARNIYLINYYLSTGDESNPILGRAIRAHQSQNRAIDAQVPKGGPVPARDYDLWRLTWPLTDAGKITPYGGMTRYGRARIFLSDYFPDFIDVPE